MVMNGPMSCKWQEDDVSLVENKTRTIFLILVEGIPFCLKYSNKNETYIYIYIQLNTTMFLLH